MRVAEAKTPPFIDPIAIGARNRTWKIRKKSVRVVASRGRWV
jgi:hypothetical protein